MTEDLLDHVQVVDEGDYPHLFLVNRALQWVDVLRLTDSQRLAGLEGAQRSEESA